MSIGRYGLEPPLGVTPLFAFDAQCNLMRVREITAAIERYVQAERPVPQEWLDELGQRSTRKVSEFEEDLLMRRFK